MAKHLLISTAGGPWEDRGYRPELTGFRHVSIEEIAATITALAGLTDGPPVRCEVREISRIRIIGALSGNASRELREALLGIELPVPSQAELDADQVLVMGYGAEDEGECLVSRTVAIEALRKAGKSEAAAFWESLGPLGKYLGFKTSCYEVVS